jgi:hypothetical protein
MGTTLEREKALLSPGTAGAAGGNKKKPRGKKQPNPLSMKKKKAATPAAPRAKEALGSTEGSGQPKRALLGHEGQPPLKRSR